MCVCFSTLLVASGKQEMSVSLSVSAVTTNRQLCSNTYILRDWHTYWSASGNQEVSVSFSAMTTNRQLCSNTYLYPERLAHVLISISYCIVLTLMWKWCFFSHKNEGEEWKWTSQIQLDWHQNVLFCDLWVSLIFKHRSVLYLFIFEHLLSASSQDEP